MIPDLKLPLAGRLVELTAGADGIVVRRDGRLVGSVRVSSRGGGLTVDALCVEPGERGRGSGSDAARTLMREAARAGFESYRAWAPPDRGLAVYFWFRMGLHPLPGHGPDGGIWLERDLRAMGDG